jgi:hypothetical protein
MTRTAMIILKVKYNIIYIIDKVLSMNINIYLRYINYPWSH